ncbi:helix-turn-helix domain-containing protein [Salinigranum salinum]|uniref:helix-turn-helix domain-containing protein n=1 Tax=Salinigranum salinum TaxID=1364937 RepID=UPI0012609FDB|nr:helix-turn-helix domain-containing protein [Salinigranum salinum]
MSEGVRATLAVHAPAECPVAALSAADAAESVDPETPPIRDVTWTRGAGGRVVEEIRVDETVTTADSGALAEADPVMTLGDERVYQFTRDSPGTGDEDVDAADGACVCEAVERPGCPIADVHAVDGTLVLTLHLADVERLREVVAELDALGERVEVRCLVRSVTETPGDGGEPGATVVDGGRLTPRQREVLRVAYEHGYFEYRGGANASEVAAALDIADSTFAEHLANAQAKLVDEFLAP